MCKFCDVLTSTTHKEKISWSVRSTFADDNIIETLENDHCVAWMEDCADFKLKSYTHEGNTFVGVEYRQELTKKNREKVIISPFSETIQFNFCPICGKQISNTVKDFKDYYNSQISIEKR